MSRLLAIDFGRRRCGLAATDTLRLVASGLTTVATADLTTYVVDYCRRESVGRIVVGLPKTLQGADSESVKWLRPAIERLRKALPAVPIVFFDERFTSAIAHRAMIDGGLGMKRRRDKALVDEMAATIILNDYLQSRRCVDDDAADAKEAF